MNPVQRPLENVFKHVPIIMDLAVAVAHVDAHRGGMIVPHGRHLTVPIHHNELLCAVLQPIERNNMLKPSLGLFLVLGLTLDGLVSLFG